MAKKKPVVRVRIKGKGFEGAIKVPSYIAQEDVAFILDKEISKRTPIDTGYARSGWQLDPKKNGNVWVENDVKYVQYLEDGHSRQAPNGFVDQAVSATIKRMRKKSPYIKRKRGR